MNLISDLFKGLVALSLFSLIQHGCSVKNMAEHAMKAHRRGLSSYGQFSRSLSGVESKWLKQNNK